MSELPPNELAVPSVRVIVIWRVAGGYVGDYPVAVVPPREDVGGAREGRTTATVDGAGQEAGSGFELKELPGKYAAGRPTDGYRAIGVQAGHGCGWQIATNAAESSGSVIKQDESEAREMKRERGAICC